MFTVTKLIVMYCYLLFAFKGEKDVSSIERSQGKRLERLIMEMIADLKLPSTTSSSSSSSESVIDTKTAEVKNVPSGNVTDLEHFRVFVNNLIVGN